MGLGGPPKLTLLVVEEEAKRVELTVVSLQRQFATNLWRTSIYLLVANSLHFCSTKLNPYWQGKWAFEIDIIAFKKSMSKLNMCYPTNVSLLLFVVSMRFLLPHLNYISELLPIICVQQLYTWGSFKKHISDACSGFFLPKSSSSLTK